jgi:hypothetical protein
LERRLGGRLRRHRSGATGAQRRHADDGASQLADAAEGMLGCHASLKFDIKKQYLINNFCNWRHVIRNLLLTAFN